MKTLSGPGGGGVVFLTVTPRVALAVRPAPSCTVRPSVCAPSATEVVFQANDAVVAEPDVPKTCPPSTVSVKAMGVPRAPVSDMPTLTVPLTVAPSAGAVNEAVSGAGPPPPPAFCTLNARVVLPELPAASRTVATSVCVPLATRVESHGSVTWFEASVPLTSVTPPMASVKVRVPAEAPSTQTSDHTVPVTVAPAAGLVMNTLSVPVPPPLLLTVTPRVTVAVCPAPSRTVRPSVWAPSATVVVFHANVAVVARSEEHTSELQSLAYIVCRLLL